MSTRNMERANVNGTELEYEVRGAGEPVMLLHCGFVADDFVPLLGEPTLTERYQLVNYHRRGYGGSARPMGPMSLSAQAADCRALMEYLGIDQAHLVGHSYGANIALQLALDAPEAVHSLVLIEPPLPGVPTEPAAIQYFMGTVMASLQKYGTGDKAGAVDTWLQGAFQPGYRESIDPVLPGWFNQATADADTVFQVEVPQLQQWTFGKAEAARITQPVLSVLHDDALWSGFQETHDLIKALIPQTETLLVPNTTHLMQIKNPHQVASGLVVFFERHPIRVHA